MLSCVPGNLQLSLVFVFQCERRSCMYYKESKYRLARRKVNAYQSTGGAFLLGSPPMAGHTGSRHVLFGINSTIINNSTIIIVSTIVNNSIIITNLIIVIIISSSDKSSIPLITITVAVLAQISSVGSIYNVDSTCFSSIEAVM